MQGNPELGMGSKTPPSVCRACLKKVVVIQEMHKPAPNAWRNLNSKPRLRYFALHEDEVEPGHDVVEKPKRSLVNRVRVPLEDRCVSRTEANL